jgi:hypothetical protein
MLVVELKMKAPLTVSQTPEAEQQQPQQEPFNGDSFDSGYKLWGGNASEAV